jgi:hypothetical protein
MLNNCILFNHRGHGEHGGDLGSTQGIRGANGAGKTKNSASKLDRFSLFSANPSLLGSFALFSHCSARS